MNYLQRLTTKSTEKSLCIGVNFVFVYMRKPFKFLFQKVFRPDLRVT